LSERVAGLLQQLEETGERLSQRASETDAKLAETSRIGGARNRRSG